MRYIIKNTTRASGILLPIFSLPSKYGIGTFGKEAFSFVDMLIKSKQKYWQILPLCPTGYGNSPYQSYSTFAGNPYFIDLDLLINEKLLTSEQCSSVDFGDDNQYVDYEKMCCGRYTILKTAYKNSHHKQTKEYALFIEQNSVWLKDYCLYMALKQFFNNAPWTDWDNDIKLRKPAAIDMYSKELIEEIDFNSFLQYYFFKQWFSLKEYANKNGIKIIGDLPIYVAMDSADAWKNPEMFQFDENLNPQNIAGVPPDAFCEEGQLWQNPLYNWENHKKNNFDWWINKLAYSSKLYDSVRIDHFRGFDEYWAIPYGDKNAKNGKWCKGPGLDLFVQIKNRLGEIDIIAEDLGVQSESLHALLSKSGYPGMKVLQFGFSNMQNSEHLPHNYSHNCVVYTGTHDNTSTLAWYKGLRPEDRLFVNNYCRVTSDKPIYDIVTSAFQSIANLVVIPLQDYLELGSESRINKPSTVGDNWKWRMKEGEFSDSIQMRIAEITRTYFRD